MRTRELRTRRLASAQLYCCTDGRGSTDAFATLVEALYSGGVDIVQLRDKSMEAAQELEYLAVLRDAAQRHGALFSVNDRADVAVLAGADIVHMGQGDLSPAQARAIIGPHMLIGRSTHALDEAAAAASDPDVDYFAVGPCWPTPTKPGRPAPGLDLVRSVSARGSGKPWFAIGGIDVARVAEVRAAGASRIVVVRALTEAAAPTAEALALRSALEV